MAMRNLFLQVMKTYLQEKRERFSKEQPVFQLVTKAIPQAIEQLPFIPQDRYVIKGSVGQGVWTDVPWVAIMNKTVTTSTQRGYYIVYLFSDDMSKLYLTFAQGVTETPKEEMIRIKQEIRQTIPMSGNVKKDDEIDLGESKKAKEYKDSVAAYIAYSIDDMPADEQLRHDLQQMIEYYEKYVEIAMDMKRASESHSYETIVNHIHSYISSKGFYYRWCCKTRV
ncbi:DUF3578 domain-containing protein, partial [Saccharococcus caldoxylosilyticus]|uniref:DUF3578 domain-containing protein n=1 Tax=Saccharococcus caldoxylosilyticus TaxID=81408 RepID=UPI00037ADD7C